MTSILVLEFSDTTMGSEKSILPDRATDFRLVDISDLSPIFYIRKAAITMTSTIGYAPIMPIEGAR
jgi:hypothetical protein